MAISKYSASAPLLGYLYQCRLALLETLKRLKDSPDINVSIETLDDVVFETEGSAIEVIQVKHHISRKAQLTDASPDLWKTIRIWCDLFSEGLVEEDSVFYLMTTEKSAENSAARCLSIECRNIEEAEKILLQTCQTSTNQSNKEGYQKYISLNSNQRRELLSKVYVLDSIPLSNELDAILNKELWGHCDRQYAVQFLQYLEGWWFQKIVSGLDGSKAVEVNITGVEVDAQLASLREQFKFDSLPIHQDIVSTNPNVELFKDWLFAKQLRLINISESRVHRAVKNYYKAFEQRSRWVRESLLVDNDLELYDDKLIEEWEIRFDQAKDSLPKNPEEGDHITSGKGVFGWAEAEAQIPIRSSCQELFITRGTYQILSNDLRVGWHPEYKTRLTSQSEVEKK